MKITVVIFVIILSLAACTVHAQSARDFYNKGLDLKESGDIEGAIEAFKKATGRDRKFAEAFYELGMCLMTKMTSPSSLKRAENAIIKARTLDWKNMKYLVALGEVNEARMFFGEAGRNYRKVLKADSTNINALSKIAENYEREMKKYRYRVDVTDGFMLYDKNMWKYYDDIYGGINSEEFIDQWLYLDMQDEIEYSSFSGEDLVKALEYNYRILELDHDNRDALFRIGILHFDSGSMDQFIDFFGRIVENNPEDKDANLFLGLGYAQKGEHDISYRYYMKAHNQMSSVEKTVFESVDYIDFDFKDKPTRLGRNPSVNSPVARFWRRKDPFFMTPYNERKMAHFGRVAEANLRFHIPRRDIPGWLTERGRIFIRYGRPLKIKEFYQIPDLISAGQQAKRNLDQWDNWRKHQFWYYDDFTFVFNASYADLENKYELSNWQGLNFIELERKIEKEYPDYYKYIPRGELVNFPADVVSFKGTGDKTLVAFFYGMPVGKIEWRGMTNNRVRGEIQHGVFVFDQKWYKVWQDIDTTEINLPLIAIEKNSTDIFVLAKEVELDPGKYNLGVEVLDPNSGNAGTLRDTMTVESYTGDTLMVSDFLIAHTILVNDPAKPLDRNNVTFFANPLHKIRILEKFYVYFEIYNLFLNPQNDQSRFRVDFTIYPVKQTGAVRRFFRNMLWRGTGGDGQSISFNYTGSSMTENILQNIDLSISKPGEYHLTMTVTDVLSGRKVNKSTLILIFEDKRR